MASGPPDDGRPARARPGSRDTPPAARRLTCASARHAAAARMRAAAVMTAATVIRESLTVPGCHHDQALAARVFSTAALTAQHPCAAVAVLLVSELVTNSMRHSDSRLPGGTITIMVTASPGSARVEVRDAGGASVPVIKGADDALAEGGRGLRLVRDLAARWGYRREADGLVTWFEVGGEPPS